EALVQRELLSNLGDTSAQRVDVGVLALCQRGADDVRDLGEGSGVQAAGSQGRGTDAQAGGDHRRARVERNGIAVNGDANLVQQILRLLAIELGVAQVSQHQVNIGAAGEHLDASTL